MPKKQKESFAVIGCGISGLFAAYCLQKAGKDVTCFEQNNYFGGHSRTIDVKVKGKTIAVDTGFIVYNHHTYPRLTKFFEALQVETAPSKMSFGVSIDNGWLEYGSQNLLSIFGAARNIFRPQFYLMIYEIIRFNQIARHNLDSPMVLGDFLTKHKFNRWFQEYYLLAMGAAIWSAPRQQILQFPCSTFLRFFYNHGLLSIFNQPKWRTVKGGSKNYVAKIISSLPKSHLGAAVEAVLPENGKVAVKVKNQPPKQFDQVIIATHANTALKILAKPNKSQQKILGSFDYSDNKIITHSDCSLMPKNKRCWSSWVYLAQNSAHEQKTSLTYWMNNLQPLDTKTPIFVTLNPEVMPKADKILDTHHFQHPKFDANAIAMQKRIDEIQGESGIWFAGAYQRYGFHEDGMVSAENVLQKLNVPLPW